MASADNTWKPTGVAWATNTGPLQVTNATGLLGVQKPGRDNPNNPHTAATEKITADLAFHLRLPIPPITLWDRGGSSTGPRYVASASGVEAEEPLATIRLDPTHRTDDFSCAKSERVTRFLREQARKWAAQRLCGVFIFPDPSDPTRILGYYTLSQYVLTVAVALANDHDALALAGLVHGEAAINAIGAKISRLHVSAEISRIYLSYFAIAADRPTA